MSDGMFKKLKILVGIEDVDDEDDLVDEDEGDMERRPVDIRPGPYSSQQRTEFKEMGSPRDKVISMNRTLNAITSQFNLVVTEPKSFEDCPKLVDSLKSRKPVIINLERVETDMARKIFDFLSGATCALNGTVQKIAVNIFVFVPENINVISNTEHKGMDFAPDIKSPWR
ncbi:MAG: cell division protein SepF [Clostridiales Family XIII bacterium]|jgi:cell division inhibitor SepF|nr:cell division protein SepF [Clostridiales Family XIII bacterium]